MDVAGAESLPAVMVVGRGRWRVWRWDRREGRGVRVVKEEVERGDAFLVVFVRGRAGGVAKAGACCMVAG